MERLTERYTDGTAFIPNVVLQLKGMDGVAKKLADYEDLEEQCIAENQCGIGELLLKWKAFFDDIAELYEYRKAEEQGLLLRLPCKVGDKVWVIDIDYEQLDSQKKKVYEAEWVRVNYVQTKEEGSFELRGEIAYQVHDYFYGDGRIMRQGMYVGQSTTKIGERVFLTREEAESALAKEGEEKE